MDFSAAERARRIRLVLFDVDGVLTDGKIWILPRDAGPGEKIFEAKGFHAHDGIGMSLARLGGLHTGIITKRSSETVASRARALRRRNPWNHSKDWGACHDGTAWIQLSFPHCILS
jgi:3-deoxy-D-manno-octulosonate 8-phosphate phosphatase (KDO 8-P phosphatase)